MCTICPAGYRCPLAKDSPIACDPGYYRHVFFGLSLSESAKTLCMLAVRLPPYVSPNIPTAPPFAIISSALVPVQSRQPCRHTPLLVISFPFRDLLSPDIRRDCASSTAASTNCTSCPAGYFCDDPEALPQPCEVGYYSGGGTAVCSACQPGYRCPEASVSATPAGSECPEGTYCNPARTLLECPSGTYGKPFLEKGRLVKLFKVVTCRACCAVKDKTTFAIFQHGKTGRGVFRACTRGKQKRPSEETRIRQALPLSKPLDRVVSLIHCAWALGPTKCFFELNRCITTRPEWFSVTDLNGTEIQMTNQACS